MPCLVDLISLALDAFDVAARSVHSRAEGLGKLHLAQRLADYFLSFVLDPTRVECRDVHTGRKLARSFLVPAANAAQAHQLSRLDQEIELTRVVAFD